MRKVRHAESKKKMEKEASQKADTFLRKAGKQVDVVPWGSEKAAKDEKKVMFSCQSHSDLVQRMFTF